MNYVGLDVHKEECQAAILDKEGELVREMRIQTSEEGFAHLAKAIDRKSKLVMEASSSFYFVHDYFKREGFEVKVAHPKQVKAIASAKIKNDKLDAKILATLLRGDMIPEVYIPDDTIRELRELLQHRQGLVKMRTEAKNRVHALLIKRGFRHQFSDLFIKAGLKWLDTLDLGSTGNFELRQLLCDIKHLSEQIAMCEKRLWKFEKILPEAKLAQTMLGMGRLSSLMVMAGIVDINRFPDPKKLASYAGLVPSLSQSGDTSRNGKITKQGSKFIREGMVIAAGAAIKRPGTKMRRFYDRVAKRRGANTAKVALARKMLCWLHVMLIRGEHFAA
jgi:transposase